jgi:DtxR family Mn-dependent transcriptional regulator
MAHGGAAVLPGDPDRHDRYDASVADYRAPEYHPAFEEYCEAVFELREDEIDVIQARIAERLEVSRPAVSEMIRRMETEGLIRLDGTTVRLTDDGTEVAERVVRRHRLAERFLTDVLDLSWADAHAEAGKWEHVISEPVEEALDRLLGQPTTCPHGNNRFTVSRITEELEFTPGLLEFLEEAQLLPGRSGRVTEASPEGTLTVEIDGRAVHVDAFAGSRIQVTTPG